MLEGNRITMIVFTVLLALLGLASPPAAAAAVRSSALFPQTRLLRAPRVRQVRLPMSFERNEGQTDGRVKYLARGAGYVVFLTGDEAVLRLGRGRGKEEVLRLKLEGARRDVAIEGEGELSGKANYFIGREAGKWRRGVALYRAVRYRGVYPGVDVVYYGDGEELEYDIRVGAGEEVKGIRLRVGGARRVRVEGGELVLEGGGGREVRFERPEAYQERGGKRQAVEARYVVKGEEVGFEVGAYDRSRELVIDPVLKYATYLGGTGGDQALGIAVDINGNAFITGTTASSDFPITSGVQKTIGGGSDVFVAKLNAAGTGLAFSTYLGGGGTDSATAIAIDSSGNSYIAGNTYSTNFPTTAGAYQTVYGGEGDGFLTKLSPDGSSLVYSTYLGGTSPDFAQGVAIDSAGSAYLTGSTRSPDFPTATPLQIGNDGCTTVNNTVTCSSDVFVTKVSPAGTDLVYSTYLGGSNADIGQAIAVDGAGNAYITGYTFSANFPIQSAFQSALAGGADAFLTELDSTGSSLLFSTFLGGSGQERAFGLVLDGTGDIFLTGDTQSANFPTTSNAFQSQYKGGGDAFVCKVGAGGTGLTYSTLLGGSSADQGTAIAVDANSNAYVTGFTQSGDFPNADSFQKVLGLSGASSCGMDICPDAFVAKLLPSGQLVYSTYLGGNGAETGQAIAVGAPGQAYVVGSTESLNFPTIAGALQSTYTGSGTSSNAFVARIDDADLAGVSLNPQQINLGNQALFTSSDPQSVTVINAGSAPLSITNISATGDFSQTNNCGTTLPSGGGTCTIQIVFTPTTTGLRTEQVLISDSAEGSPHQITMTGTGVSSSGGSATVSPDSLVFSSVPVGSTSPSQVARLTNTGKTALTLTDISVNGDFAQTNTCGTLPTSLNVGDSCAVSVMFSPTASGKRTGGLSFADDAGSGTQSVSLSGTGEALFSLSASSRSTVIQVGTKTTTFTVNASAPSTFTESIGLSCSSGVATCSFDPPTITAGESSTLTISGLSASTSSPVNLTVEGKAGNQTAYVTLSVFLADFSVAASPALTTISSGQSAPYTVTVTPTNGFSGVVLLACANLPRGATCSWSPSAVTVNGAAVTAKLTIDTISNTQGVPFGSPGGPLAGDHLGVLELWLTLFGLLAAWAVWRRVGEGEMQARMAARLRLVVLAMLLSMAGAGTACSNYSYGPNLTSLTSGTPLGRYTIVITGTLGNDSTVRRSTSVNLAVGS